VLFGREKWANKMLGGEQDPTNPFDFYDVTNFSGVIGSRTGRSRGRPEQAAHTATPATAAAQRWREGYNDDSSSSTIADGWVGLRRCQRTGLSPDSGITSATSQRSWPRATTSASPHPNAPNNEHTYADILDARLSLTRIRDGLNDLESASALILSIDTDGDGLDDGQRSDVQHRSPGHRYRR
jgi:hypothetical protein